jgi:ElaB/YqjD/DUF883 family membrane-anchored ribosome-binding protein
MLEGLSKLSINKLVNMLREAISRVVNDLDKIVEENKSLSMTEINTLREHIEERLNRGENVKENEELIKLIDLFLTDKYVLEFIKGDSEEWLSFITAIRESVEAGKLKPGSEDGKDVMGTIKELESILRK